MHTHRLRFDFWVPRPWRFFKGGVLDLISYPPIAEKPNFNNSSTKTKNPTLAEPARMGHPILE